MDTIDFYRIILPAVIGNVYSDIATTYWQPVYIKIFYNEIFMNYSHFQFPFSLDISYNEISSSQYCSNRFDQTEDQTAVN